jgi:hypothetical protein
MPARAQRAPVAPEILVAHRLNDDRDLAFQGAQVEAAAFDLVGGCDIVSANA